MGVEGVDVREGAIWTLRQAIKKWWGRVLRLA